MRKFVFAVIATCCYAAPARAQSSVFIGGDIFADLKRLSSDSSTSESTLDGNAVGGGGSFGVNVADRWSVALALDQGASTTRSTPIPIGVLAGVVGSNPISAFRSQTTNRLFATSALLGYHAASGHRYVGVRRLRPNSFQVELDLVWKRHHADQLPTTLAKRVQLFL
jgi:hypothetical protein